MDKSIQDLIKESKPWTTQVQSFLEEQVSDATSESLCVVHACLMAQIRSRAVLTRDEVEALDLLRQINAVFPDDLKFLKDISYPWDSVPQKKRDCERAIFFPLRYGSTPKHLKKLLGVK